MDPDETLETIRAALREALATKDVGKRLITYAAAADHMETLDNWITNGGFLPTAWCGVRYVSNVTSNIAPPPVAEDEPKYEEPGDLYDEDERRMRNSEFPLRGGS